MNIDRRGRARRRSESDSRVSDARGKVWPNDRPGLGVSVAPAPLARAQARLAPAKVTRNQSERPVPYMPEFLGRKALTFIEAMTEAAPGPTHRRPDGSLTHW